MRIKLVYTALHGGTSVSGKGIRFFFDIVGSQFFQLLGKRFLSMYPTIKFSEEAACKQYSTRKE